MLLEQDLYILLNFVAHPMKRWTFATLSRDLAISTSQLHLGLARSSVSGLYQQDERRVVREALEEFILHGVRYAFPVERGSIVRGMPTSFAGPSLKRKIMHNAAPNMIPVWEDPEGEAIGYAIAPLHVSAPKVCKHDFAFYEILSLVDAIREGRTRERNLAGEEIRARIQTM